MDQGSNMGGFNPMPNMVGSNNGFQAAPTGNVPQNNFGGVAPVTPIAPVSPVPAPNQPVNPPMAPTTAPTVAAKPEKKNTLVETLILVGVCLIAATAIVFAVIFFMQYNELKTNYESEKSLAISDAVKVQQDKDEAAYEERAKLPYYSFTGPSDYGSISFEYPKTWSVYVDKDGTNNSDYVAYFQPKQVDPVSGKSSRYALRFQILNRQITTVQSSYEAKIKNGKLTSRAFSSDDNALSGTWYEGEIADGIRGIVILLKVNDKTLVVQTDAEAYRSDFETLVKKLRRNS
jgi:cell division protein FtsL